MGFLDEKKKKKRRKKKAKSSGLFQPETTTLDFKLMRSVDDDPPPETNEQNLFYGMHGWELNTGFRFMQHVRYTRAAYDFNYTAYWYPLKEM